MPWNPTDLDRVRQADQIDIAPIGPTGALHRWVTIWAVSVDDTIVVRAYRGTNASWYRVARGTERGRMRVGSDERAVIFEPAQDIDSERVDAAYRTTYGQSAYVDSMLDPIATATTLRIHPDDEEQP